MTSKTLSNTHAGAASIASTAFGYFASEGMGASCPPDEEGSYLEALPNGTIVVIRPKTGEGSEILMGAAEFNGPAS